GLHQGHRTAARRFRPRPRSAQAVHRRRDRCHSGTAVIGRHQSERRPLDDRDFRRLAALIHDRSGIRMPPSKKTFLEGRMRRHMRRRGFGELAEYCRWLFSEGGLAEDEDALIAPVPLARRKRYLLRDDANDEVRIAPELRRTVRFVHHNLMNAPYPAHLSTDIVVCRNLLIYFDRATQRDVLNRLCRHVRPGGYLILGHSEGVVGLTLPLRAV